MPCAMDRLKKICAAASDHALPSRSTDMSHVPMYFLTPSILPWSVAL